MAIDEGLAQMMRDDLTDVAGLEEKRMFGGLAFLSFGHMICGVHKDGAMYRVGKEHYPAALALPGVGEMQFTGRPMGGMVEVEGETFVDDDLRAQLTQMALGFVATLPPKPGKS
jgi:hypothetical protein